MIGHGLAGDITETRPLGSGVRGRRVFLQLSGATYPALAAEVAAAADETAATRAVGVSMSAAALLHLLATAPDRFERLVFFLPAVLDRPSTVAGVDRLRALAGAGDLPGLTEALLEELPPPLRTAPARAWTQGRAARLVADPRPLALAGRPPLSDRTVLRRVRAPALVIAQRGDRLHPLEVGTDLAAALPAAELHVLDGPGGLWVHRGTVRRLVTGFLNR